MAGKMDELDQGQRRLLVLPGRQGTSSEKMDSDKLLLHTDSDEAWIIPCQAAEIWISGHGDCECIQSGADTVETCCTSATSTTHSGGL